MTHQPNLGSFPSGGLAVVVGASGGIGAAVAAAIGASGVFAHVLEASRSGQPSYDITRQDHVAALAGQIKASGHDLRLVFDATGYLHGPHGGPEKSWSAIDPTAMAHQFAVNTIGPALLIKHLLPLLPRDDKAVFATISAKVGSISDNQLGGWYGYRSAKAALNQIVKTASIELARKRPDAICIALHPGTVATPLSDPFAKQGVRLQTPQESAASMLEVINKASNAQSGQLIAYDGTILPY
jgi:NAD(P)-dependent dehydrogenase (short-subunit alcohol dehydrogenase family)